MTRIFVLLFFLFAFSAIAQRSVFSEKYHALKNSQLNSETKADSIYSMLFKAISNKEKDLDSLSEDFFTYTQSQKSKKLQALSYIIKAQVDKKNDNNVEGITNLLKGINLLDSIKHRKELCTAYQQLAFMYSRTNNFALAAPPTLKALKIAEELKDNTLLFDSYNAIGISYIREKKFDEAKNFYRKAIAVALTSNNKLQLTRVFTNIGIAFRNQKNWDSALYYHNKSLLLAREIKNNFNIAFALNDIGVIYLNLEEYDKGLEYLFQSAEIREREGERWELGFTYNFIAECYINQSKFKECEVFVRKAIAISYLSKNVRQRYESYEYMSVLNQFQNRLDSAYFYLQLHTALKDSFQRARNNFATDALVASYQFEEKEKEIKLLNETTENQELQIQKQQLYLVSIAVGIILLTVIVFLFIRTRQQKGDKLLLEAKLHEEAIKRDANEKLQKEKERISRDLHDNVGGQLSYVLYSLDGINTEDKSKRIEITSNVNESVRNVISNLRETIWAINDEAISINDFSDKLKVYVRSMFRNTETKISFTENIQIDTQLNSLVGLNLYRICQEIINNAFKHSKATELLVNITSDKHVVIEIKDNGVGFDLELVEKDGFGLANIKSRAAEVGITLELESKLNNGVKYKLLV
jgi:signal transduction histidine kinase